MTSDRLLPWVLRAAWAVLPFAAGPAFDAALADRSSPVQATSSVGLWALWAAVLVATLVPHPVALTVVRVFAPAGALVTAAAVADTGESVLSLAVWVVALAAAFAPEVGVWFVNGPAYPNERRYPLRVPGPLAAGPLEVAWLLTVGAPAAGVLLVAAGQWVAGAAVLVVAAPVVVVLGRSLYSLARRWVVFVPAGLVLHDPLSLVDPVLFRRQDIEALRPAPADTDSLDLTRGSLGMAVELLLTEKVPMALSKPGSKVGDQGASARLLFTPTRPGRVLAEAAQRRLPVG